MGNRNAFKHGLKSAEVVSLKRLIAASALWLEAG